jgi:aminoglycoside phosphotransferase (APT) family kinase protein
MDQSIAAILDHIHDQHQASWTLVRKLSGGYHLGAYELVASDATRAVLKWWPGTDAPNELSATARAVEDARVAGWPTPEWFAYGALPDGREYLVQEFIDGSELTGLRSREVDQLLTANRLQSDRRPGTRRNWSEFVRRVVFAGADGLAERMRADPESALLLRRVEDLTARARDLPLPSNDLVHGDFGPVNVLVRDGKCYLIDADHAGKGCRAIDLAEFLTGATVGRYSPELLASDARRVKEECVGLVGNAGLLVCIAASMMGLVAFALDHSTKTSVYISRCHMLLDTLEG